MIKYILLFLGVYACHLFLELNWVSTAVLGGYALIVLPAHLRLYRRGRMEELRFLDVSSYMDTLLYTFLKEEKIERSFENLLTTLPEGKLHDTVFRAVEHMKLTYDDSKVCEDALKMVEQEYSCERVSRIHAFVCHVEEYGGEIATPVRLLLEDKNRWEQRIRATMLERKKLFREVLLSIVVSLLICAVILHLPMLRFEVSHNPLVQVVTILVLVLDDIIFFRAQRYLCVDWLKLDVRTSEQVVQKKLQRWKQYDEKKEKKLSIVLFTIGVAVSVFLQLRVNAWLAFLAMCLSVFLLEQHRIGRRMLQKELMKNIRSAFPAWLMDLVLLMQSENVQVAIEKSRYQAPAVLQGQIQMLLERLELNPESAAPYHAFFEEFTIPEVRSAMNMLYSISMGNSSHADRQLGELINRNLHMMDVTEQELLKNKAAMLYVLFLMPVLTASVKMIVDMLVMMLSFFSTGIF